MRPLNPDHLGDGIYATAQEDGSILLTTGTDDPVRDEATNVICLETEHMDALIRYYERAKETR